MKKSHVGFQSTHSALLLLSKICNDSRDALFNEKQEVEIRFPTSVGLEAMLTLSYLSALSVELGLKATMADLGLTAPREHDLLLLMNLLPIDMQKTIETSVCLALEIGKVEYADLLEANALIFPKWRYFHELSAPSNSAPSFLMSIATAIRKMQIKSPSTP